MNLDSFCTCFQQAGLFRNHIVGFPTKWLIYSLHHKQLKISLFFLLTFTLRGVSNKPCLLPILVSDTNKSYNNHCVFKFHTVLRIGFRIQELCHFISVILVVAILRLQAESCQTC